MKKFAENSLVIRFQKWMADAFGFTFLFNFKGRGIFQKKFGILPFRVPINTVVGSPVSVQQCDNPSQEQIDELHQKYLDALTSLYNEYNPIYGNEDVKLNIM